MKRITRDEAETLFLASNVVSSNIEQDKNEMRIHLTLSDDRSFLVKYDFREREKSYFLDDPKV